MAGNRPEVNHIGMRHVALNVADPQRSKEFYQRVLAMELEWEPDAENVYLTSQGFDNLAIHKATGAASQEGQTLDHIGFILPTLESVDSWYEWVRSQPDAKILKEIKTHRDGARSFYFGDPDGVIIQMIYHPPIAERRRD